MNQAIRKRLEALERAALPPVAPLDWFALTAVEFEVYRAAYTELAAGAITAKESGDLCALVATGAPFPYPIRSEPSFGHPPHLRVLIGGTVRRQRWHGWPGYRPLGWERHLFVGADGALLRMDGTAVFAADPGATHDPQLEHPPCTPEGPIRHRAGPAQADRGVAKRGAPSTGHGRGDPATLSGSVPNPTVGRATDGTPAAAAS